MTKVPISKSRRLHGSSRNCCRLAAALLVFTLFGPGCTAPEPHANLTYFPSERNARVVHLLSFNSLGQIVPKTPTWRDWLLGPAWSPFVEKPAGLAAHQSKLYICDTGADIVHIWNLETGDAETIGDRGSSRLIKPVAVAVGDDGTIYVADTGRGEVVAFYELGESLARFRPNQTTKTRPTAVAVHGDRLFVAEITRHVVDVYSTSSHDHVAQITGGDQAPFYFPMGVACAEDGRIYVSDMMNGRIQVFDKNFAFLRTMGRPGDRYGDLGKPRHLATSRLGHLYVADPEFKCVHIFSGKGDLLMLLQCSANTSDDARLPIGVATLPALPAKLNALVPFGFRADYFLFTSSTIGAERLSLFAVGQATSDRG